MYKVALDYQLQKGKEKYSLFSNMQLYDQIKWELEESTLIGALNQMI